MLLHDSHGLVVRILANGAGGLGSNSGGVTCSWKSNDIGSYGVTIPC